VSAHGSANDRNRALAPTICFTMKAALHHVRRSCDLSSLTNSAAHSRASGIFPASRKARAFAKAWLSADRSAADSFPARALRALRAAADMLRIGAGPRVQLGFGRRQISIVGASTATSIRCHRLAVSLPRMLEQIEAHRASAGLCETRRLRQRAELIRELLTRRHSPTPP
jgi:hypothetical protein